MSESSAGTVPVIRRREQVYANPHHSTHVVHAEFDGFAKEYFVTQYPTRAGVVVVRNESVLLVRQYRLLVDSLGWEIPGGAVDDDETPQQAAIRECREETGLHCLDLNELVFYHLSLDVTYNPTFLFYTDRVSRPDHAPAANPTEIMESHWVPLHRCIEMIFAKQILDSFTIVALLAYRALRERQALRNEPGSSEIQ